MAEYPEGHYGGTSYQM